MIEKSPDFRYFLGDQTLADALAAIAAAVNDDIAPPPQDISNISEWARKDGCWSKLAAKCEEIADNLPEALFASPEAQSLSDAQSAMSSRFVHVATGIQQVRRQHRNSHRR